MNEYWTEVLFESLWDGNANLFREAVFKGGDLTSLDERGNSIMSVAVASGEEMVRTALSEGADPNQPNSDENTCLRSAVLIGDVNLVQALLSTPLESAQNKYEEDCRV